MLDEPEEEFLFPEVRHEVGVSSSATSAYNRLCLGHVY